MDRKTNEIIIIQQIFMMDESEEFYYEIKGYGTYSTRVEGHGQ